MKPISIVTHSGTFHADDVFAVAMVKLLLKDTPHTLTRTRDTALMESADWLLDIGNTYNPETKRFDHHMREGAGARENGIPFAACGLVWKHYGETLAGSTEARDIVDEQLIQTIDALDNGSHAVSFNPHLGDSPYTIRTLIQRSFRPAWNSTESFDDAFNHAVTYAQEILLREIHQASSSIAKRTYAQKLYDESTDKRILISPLGISAGSFIPFPDVQIVIAPDLSKDGYFAVQAVGVSPDTFDARVYFPESWAGLRDEALVTLSGVPGAVFCHKGRHFAVANNLADAQRLALLAL
jgi:uncharacterized UPF0160 family protein